MTLEMFMEPYHFDEWSEENDDDRKELFETEIEVIEDYVDTIGGFEKVSEKDKEKIKNLSCGTYNFAN